MELTAQLFFFVLPVRLTMAVVMVVKDELASWFCIPEGVKATRLRAKTTPKALQEPPCNQPAGQVRPKNAILRYVVIGPLRCDRVCAPDQPAAPDQPDQSGPPL